MNRVLDIPPALFIPHLIARVLNLGLIILLMPRYFSADEMGNYFLAIFITSLIVSITELGIHAPLVREMNLYLQEARHFIGNALIIRICLSIVACGLMAGSAYLLDYPPITLQMIYLLGLAEVINSIAQLFRCVFRAFEQTKYETLTVLAERGSVVFVGGALIVLEIDLVSFCIIVLIASVLNLILSVGIVAVRLTPLRFKLDLEIWRLLMRRALPFSLGTLFYMIYFRIDAVMLSKLSPHGIAATGWYGLAYTIAIALPIMAGALMGAMLPAMSRAFENEKADFRPIYTGALRSMFLLGMPFAVGMATLADEISIALLPNYDQTTIAPALRLLSWSGGLTFLTTVVVAVLRATGKRRPFALLMGTTALLHIGLNFMLIPGIQLPGTDIALASHVGAATSMLISEGYLCITGFIYISRRISKPIEIGFGLKAIAVSALMGVGLIYLRSRFSIRLLIPAAIAIYVAAMAILGEIRRLRQTWS
ncbi:MAG: flippase [Candidatus Poribacteria bacterium]|nr:flippase [Candidatus Poribacteria bacterium]